MRRHGGTKAPPYKFYSFSQPKAEYCDLTLSLDFYRNDFYISGKQLLR